MSDGRYDVIVIGGGVAGVVCATTLAHGGAQVLLIAETKRLGHNVRSVEIDGHRCQIQPPVWAYSWNDGGSWARLVRQHNLGTKVHFPPAPEFSLRGSKDRARLPVLLSARSICETMFQWIPIPVDDDARADVERVMQAGLLIPPSELSVMHEMPLSDWLDDQKPGELGRLIVEYLASILAGLPRESVASTMSVFGTFATVRLTVLGGEGSVVMMEPDIQTGFIEPLAARFEEYGGTLWRGTHVDHVIIENQRAQGVQMNDGRVATAPQVAVATGNARIPAFFKTLPEETIAPLEKELPLKIQDLFAIRLLDRKIADTDRILLIADLGNDLYNWFVPESSLSPWNSPDDRQLCMLWSGTNRGDAAPSLDEVEDYLDDIAEETFPGFKAATVAKARITHRHHWMHACYAGPKIPRRSPTIEGLWYCGDGTTPVGGIGVEQAAYAGHDGARRILATR